MFCPQCGQRQITNEARFCSGCGFPLNVVGELLANNGQLPWRPPQPEAVGLSPRHRARALPITPPACSTSSPMSRRSSSDSLRGGGGRDDGGCGQSYPESADLAARLRERIRREGAITFREWMRAALYDERGGYY